MSFLPRKNKKTETIEQDEQSTSLNRFVWRSNSNACDLCKNLDGKYFDEIADIPDQPHPNCLCWIEYYGDDEPPTPQQFQKELEERKEKLEGDASSLEEEIEQMKSNIEDIQGGILKGRVEENVDNLEILKNEISDVRKVLETYPQMNAQDIEQLQQNLVKQEEYYKTVEKNLEKEIKNQENMKENPFVDDVKKHQEMQNLIKYVQDKCTEKDIGNYQRIEKIHDKETELDVSIFKNDKEVVLVFPGSEQATDYWQDFFDLYKKQENPQLEKAQEVFDKVKNDPKLKDCEISVAGYSIGGNTAQIIGATNNVNTVTFEPYRGAIDFVQKIADKKGETVEIHPEKVINYRHVNDNFSQKDGHIGTTYYTYKRKEEGLTPKNWIKRKRDNNAPVTPHFLPNIGKPTERTNNPVHIDRKTIYTPRYSPAK